MIIEIEKIERFRTKGEVMLVLSSIYKAIKQTAGMFSDMFVLRTYITKLSFSLTMINNHPNPIISDGVITVTTDVLWWIAIELSSVNVVYAMVNEYIKLNTGGCGE